MKVMHIIPAAFHYFNDIRGRAWHLIDDLNRLGIENEAITIQFGSAEPEEAPWPEAERAAGSARPRRRPPAPARTYQGAVSVGNAFASFDSFDIIHAHCPLFGAAGKILRWKRAHPDQPLLLTYYRPVLTPDFLSLLIVAYNWWYLPKLCRAAERMAVFSRAALPRRLAAESRLVEINDNPEWFDLDVSAALSGRPEAEGEILATKYAMVYTTLVQE